MKGERSHKIAQRRKRYGYIKVRRHAKFMQEMIFHFIDWDMASSTPHRWISSNLSVCQWKMSSWDVEWPYFSSSNVNKRPTFDHNLEIKENNWAGKIMPKHNIISEPLILLRTCIVKYTHADSLTHWCQKGSRRRPL